MNEPIVMISTVALYLSYVAAFLFIISIIIYSQPSRLAALLSLLGVSVQEPAYERQKARRWSDYSSMNDLM